MTNTLYYGDNLDILRQHIPDESVDLVYLDPPFNSNASYNVLFKERSGEESPAQIKAFTDTWEWTQESERIYEREIITNPDSPPAVKEMIWAFRQFVGANAMMAYLVMMAPRLVELRRVLKPTGSIYLHCDPTASHYLKVLMDTIFGPENFQSEIIWKRQSAHSDARRYGSVHDTVLFYGKSGSPVWNPTFQPYDSEYIEQYYRYVDEDGRRFMSGDLGAAGLQGGGYEYEWKGVTRVWRVPVATMERLETEGRIFYTRNGIPRMKRYLDEAKGNPIQDVWPDIQSLRSWHKERLGYPTQKPQALLERIISASSNEGDVVLDPFCGCGTAVAAAQKLKRQWIGIDVTHLAVALMKNRLRTAFDIVSREGLRGRRRAGRRRQRPRSGGAGPLPVPVLGHVAPGGAAARERQKGSRQGHRRARLLHRRAARWNEEGRRTGEERQGVVASHPRPERHRRAREGRSTLHHPGGAHRRNADRGRQCGLLPLLSLAEGLPKIQIRTIAELLDGKSFEVPPHPSMYQAAERVRRSAGRQSTMDDALSA